MPWLLFWQIVLLMFLAMVFAVIVINAAKAPAKKSEG